MRTVVFAMLGAVACSGNKVATDSVSADTGSTMEIGVFDSGSPSEPDLDTGDADTRDTGDADTGDADTGDADTRDTGDADTGDTPSGGTDADSDGFTVEEGDCDDLDDAVYPSAAEVCDGVDNDCDGSIDPVGTRDGLTWYRDSDGDGYGVEADSILACTIPATDFVRVAGDCDDGDSTVHPDAPEYCDEIDQDCDGVVDVEIATFFGADGSVEDVSDAFDSTEPGVFEIAESGTLSICGGTWHTRLDLSASSVLIQGVGPVVTTINAWSTGSVISASEAVRDLEIRGLTLTGGAALQGGGVFAVNASVTIAESVIEANSAEEGGGVFVGAGDLTLENSIVQDNTATSGDGGGAYIGDGELSVTDASFIANSADENGGGFYVGGPAELVRVEVLENTAARGGGAYIYSVAPVDVNMWEVSILDNIASGPFVGRGGGLVIQAGNLNMYDSTVSGNRAEGRGGGISVVGDVSLWQTELTGNIGTLGGGAFVWGDVFIDDTEISGNEADRGGGVYLWAWGEPISFECAGSVDPIGSFGLFDNGLASAFSPEAGGLSVAAPVVEVVSDNCDWGTNPGADNEGVDIDISGSWFEVRDHFLLGTGADFSCSKGVLSVAPECTGDIYVASSTESGEG
jgi:predicted outer membrane repeat protein